MSEKEFKSYRFNDETDPTDEQLAELMRQAAQEARDSNEIANKRFFETLHKDVKRLKTVLYPSLNKYDLNP